jgi:hypothetical protein
MKSLIKTTITTFVLIVMVVDVSQAQWNVPRDVPDRNQNQNDIIFLGDTDKFDNRVLIIRLSEATNLPNYYPQPQPGENLPSYPPGNQVTQVLVCQVQKSNQQVVRLDPSPCSTIDTLARLPASSNCEMQSVSINISDLKASISQSNEKLIESTPINISSIFNSATQEKLRIKSSQSQSWKSFWPSPNVGNICKIPWPPIWPPPATPTPPSPPTPSPPATPSPSPTSPSTPVPEPNTNLGIAIGIFGLAWLYNKKKRALKSSKLKNYK